MVLNDLNRFGEYLRHLSFSLLTPMEGGGGARIWPDQRPTLKIQDVQVVVLGGISNPESFKYFHYLHCGRDTIAKFSDLRWLCFCIKVRNFSPNSYTRSCFLVLSTGQDIRCKYVLRLWQGSDNVVTFIPFSYLPQPPLPVEFPFNFLDANDWSLPGGWATPLTMAHKRTRALFCSRKGIPAGDQANQFVDGFGAWGASIRGHQEVRCSIDSLIVSLYGLPLPRWGNQLH